jgi:ribosome-associated protein
LQGRFVDYKSKTQKKKEAESLQKLGEKLVRLSTEQLEEFGLPVELFDAVQFAKTIKQRIALKRQMQYIGTLMRKIDPGPIKEEIDHLEQGNYRKAEVFKEIEKWRDELTYGNKTLMEDILEEYPSADRQQLSQHIRNAIKERENNKPPRASRTLFRYLRAIRSENSD